MKKITLFLVAMTMSLLSFAVQPKRIYAYDLSSTLVDKVYTFSFTANETPTSGKIIFYDATSSELVGEIALTNPVLGKNEVEIAEYSLPGNDGQQLNWAVELSAAAVTAYEKIFADASHRYRRGYSNVDVSPESDHFGHVYVADRTSTKSLSKFYVYNPVYAISDANGHTLGADTWGFGRFTIAPDGMVWLTDYTDGHSGLFLVDPDNLTTATQFFAGTRASSGLFKNGSVEVGSSLSCASLYGKGADTKLVTVAEDYTGKSFPVAVFNVGQLDGTLAKTWTTAPNILFNTLGNAAQIFDIKACEQGVWVATNRATGSNNSGATSLRFYTWDGACTWSSHEHTDLINGSSGGSLAITPDEKQIVMKIQDNIIAIFDVTWSGNTPTLKLNDSFNCGYAAVSAINLDYAGNIVTVAGTAFAGTDTKRMSLAVYSNPTNNNTCEVPAKKADVVTKVEPTVALYTITTNVNDPTMGSVSGNLGTYEDGASAELTAIANDHYEFTGWTGDVNSTENPLTITVNSDMTIIANFQEHTKYTITAVPNDENMGTVTGGGTYYAGETVTLTAVAKSTYYFVNWSDGNTNATRTFPASANLTLTANFAKANPRAWAYDLKMVEEGDNYKFSFTATTAANATLLFLDKEGNELYAAHNIGAVAAGANTVSIEKSYFTQVKDVYWSVQMDGGAITAVAEITDQSRGIYDFYSTLGVTVDNNPNSEYFGKVYVQATLNGASDGATTRAKEQTAGLFIYNQLLDELNPTSNVGIQPSLPSGYSIGGTNQFNRLAIDPTTNNITYCYAISGKPAVFSMDRANLTGTPANLLAGQSDITRSVAHCFDTDGALYVMDLPGSGTIYKIKDGIKTQLTETTNKFVHANITMTSDGRGGLWVSQNRGQMDNSPYYYQLAHVTSAGAIDWAVNKQTPHGFEGGSSRGALAYDSERQILAQGRNGKVELYTVSYEPTITVTPLHTIADANIGNNIDGLAFDFAGDLYVVNSSKEKFQKFTLPTADNICTVPAPESQAIIKEVRYNVTVNVVGNGTATGAGEYVAGETATLIASPAAHHQFVNWTFADATTSIDNPLELFVNSDITVTAHFEPIQYTVVALTNDENKGTVSGAGAYNYGTEVTLTATPKTGYKLLYWSDRSTENPRNITMTKNEAISAYFVKIYDEEPTFTITKLWENLDAPASTNNGYQAVGWDGKIYLKDRGNDVINVYSDATTSATYASTDSKDDQSIAVDDAGNLVLRSGSTNFYDAPKQVILYKKGETTYKTIDFTLPVSGRCDFISASGDLFSAKGGYVYFYCQYQTTVSRLHVKNGGATAGDIVIDAVGAGITGGNSQSHVMVDIFGNLVTHSRTAAINKTINAYTGEATTFTLPNDQKAIALGGCSFELGGKEFWAYNVKGSNICNTEWNLYNMTDKKYLSNEILYVENNTDKNSAANWLNVQVVDENTAYIYQFCPTVAMAVWKVSLVRNDLENFTITATANNALMGSIVGSGEYYEGGTAMLTANAYPGFRFVNWTKEGVEVSTDATYLFTVTEDVELVANFEVILLDTENNEGILTKLNDQTVDVAVYRSLTAGMYNTLCLPFDVDDFSGTPLENTTVWQYNGAEVKGEGDSKEIFLEFTEVISLEAGQPYLVEPAAEIEAPMVFNGVTISAINGSEVAQSAVTMHGILHPTELEANNKSILFLVENNNLAWANETANMNGMRAYFKVNEPSLLSARTRAYIRREPTVATDMENITTPETEIKKVIYNGTLYVIRGDEVYTIQGTKVK